MTGSCSALRETGFVWMQSAFAAPAEAFATSQALIEECSASNGQDALSVIGNFILPPPDGAVSRSFQTLHFDFGLPVRPLRGQDVARYTALSVPQSAVGVTAVTRLVPLPALLGQRRWSDRATLVRNLQAYGESYGAWDDADGYSEGGDRAADVGGDLGSADADWASSSCWPSARGRTCWVGRRPRLSCPRRCWHARCISGGGTGGAVPGVEGLDNGQRLCHRGRAG
ncbi:MAG TPA: hypothetical protein VIK04_03965 [Solirubrobacteraceae bacterium]